ncbi:gem (nuclear organelle) associated protein 2 [Boothiomyces sp. JEL0866]|nr:gem (nuclear organelle) associated protein 2 [Boothiomyces sp. JEL0866]KAJ3324591.1 gem (nuclear organelle) associated protein 2 [Boothiomyces sp. JEL0866]
MDEEFAKPQLPVAPVAPQRIPQTGEEYLAQVRQQAMTIPDWTTSKSEIEGKTSTLLSNPRTLFIQATDPCKISPEHCPSQGWIKERIQDFIKLRELVTSFPKELKPKIKSDNQEWKKLMYNSNQVPSFKYISALDQNRTMKLLECHSQWYSNYQVNMNQWIYALLLRCDNLLEADNIHTLRKLASKIRQRRITLEFGSEFIGCTLLITIIAYFYGQKDLAD